MAEIHKLKAMQVEAATKPGRLSDGGGLYLNVSRGGTKSWIFMYRHGGRRREMGLGSAGKPGITLAQARQKAAQARDLLADGGDPLAVKKAAEKGGVGASTTFGAFADEYVADHRDGWSNPKHAAQWAMTLGDAYCRKIRRLPIGSIGVDEVLSVLRPVWLEKPETARRIRMRLERVLDAARVRGLRTGENPARSKGQLELLLPKQPKADGHHAAMPWAEVPAFMEALAEREGMSALSLRFLILTAARTGEVIEAEWSEIDFDEALWTIPAARMKARRPHRVPLSAEALAVLREVEGVSDQWVFPTNNGRKPQSNMAMLTLLKRMKVTDAVPHGFRSSFRDWVAEATNFSGELAERALAHVVASKTEAAYRRGDALDRRRALMDAWAAFCVPREAEEKVTDLRAGRA